MAAHVLTVRNDQGVVLVENLSVRIQRVFENAPQSFVIFISFDYPQPLENAPGIRVDYEHRTVKCVKQNIVGRLGTDTVYRQQRPPQFVCGEPGDFSQPALLDQPAHMARSRRALTLK